MLHSEVSDVDDLDLSAVGQHLGSPHMTMSDATRFTETRDEEAAQGEGEARRRRGLETGRWNTTQGSARVESGAHSRREEHDNRPRCHVSSSPRSTCADPREIDKSIWTLSHNSDELVSVDVRPPFLGSCRRRIKINAIFLSFFFEVSSLNSVALTEFQRRHSECPQKSFLPVEYLRRSAPLDVLDVKNTGVRAW